MFKKLTLVGGVAVLLASLAAGSAFAAGGFSLKGPPKVAFLYFKAKNDGGWTQAFEEARPKMEKALGMKIPYVENIAEDAAQIKPPAEKFIQRGYNIIIGTAFGYSDTFKELAKKYPERRLPERRRHDQRPEPASRSTAAPIRASICAAWSPAR